MSQLFEDGKVVVVDGVELECVAVGYQENPDTQERHSHTYTFRVKSELDDERAAAQKAEEEAAEAARLNEEATNQPAPGEVQ